VVRVPLDDAHEGLHLLEKCTLFRGHDRFEPRTLLVVFGPRPIDEDLDAAESLVQVFGIRLEELHVLGEQGVEMRLDPGIGLELKRVGRLVEGKPHPEIFRGEAERLLYRRNVWLDVVQLAGVHGLATEQRHVVLTENPASQISEENTELGTDNRSIRSAPQERNDRGAIALLRI
jgi:hypothetical protein